LLQETLVGANRGASRGVFVKIRNPHRISFDSFESSSVGSVSGFLGNSQAVIIVVREEISGPLLPAREQAVAATQEIQTKHNRYGNFEAKEKSAFFRIFPRF